MNRLTATALGVLLMAGCSGDSNHDDTTSSTPEQNQRVQALMDAAGCVGKPIGTQLFSYETGRCNMPGGGEVTVAVFNTNDLRDQWLDAASGFGGNPVKGDGWAAQADSPDDATAFAAANP